MRREGSDTVFEAVATTYIRAEVKLLRKDDDPPPPACDIKKPWITDRKPKKEDGRYVIAWFDVEGKWFSTYRKRVKKGQPWLPVKDLLGNHIPDEGPKVKLKQ